MRDERGRPNTDLEQIDGKMFQLFALVVEALAAATDALLSGDRHVAAVLSGRDELVDNVYNDVERLVNRAVALEARDKKDLRFLLTALRVVPELERSHELAEHIARRAAYGLGAELTPRARGLIDRMGKVGMTMWRKAADCWYDKETRRLIPTGIPRTKRHTPVHLLWVLKARRTAGQQRRCA